MGYEVDFLPVGDSSRSGDAILMRWGDLSGARDRQTVIAVDGGFDDNAEKISEHVRRYYRTDRLDLVVSTHPDADHVNGLRGVLDLLKVDRLWMHRPWNHVPARKRAIIRQSLNAAYELEQIAKRKSIPIIEPFAGVSLERASGLLRVVGPTSSYYQELLEEFDAFSSQATSRSWTVHEDWWTETLDDKGETTAENNSSAILGLQYGNKKLLLTGDAGIPALDRASDILLQMGWLQNLSFAQVPHHGSKRNVGPTILNRLLGGILDQGQQRGIAFVSCATNGRPKHPHKKVTNAFRRRGYPVFQTAGSVIYHSYGAPTRYGWTSIQPLPLYVVIEDD